MSVCLSALCVAAKPAGGKSLPRLTRSHQHPTSPGRGEGSLVRDTLLFCPSKYSGNAGQTGGRSPLSCVCAANIFFKVLFPSSFSKAFLPLNKCQEGVDCKRPLRHNYFTIMTFTGRPHRAILLLHPLYFNLSFTLFFSSGCPNKAVQGIHPCSRSGGGLKRSPRANTGMFDVTQQLETKISFVH